jgi:hypothetical protein
MTDIEAKALALVNEVRRERDGASYTEYTRLHRDLEWSEALCRAIEQHEAFKQEVSEIASSALAMYKRVGEDQCLTALCLREFIIPKPKRDPLVEIMEVLDVEWTPDEYAKAIRAQLDTLGFEIREKGQ